MKVKTFVLIILLAIATVACGQKKSYVPKSILQYQLTRLLQGEEAKAFINKLHFKRVAPVESMVGFYKNGEKQGIVYVTVYQDSQQAQKDWQTMVDKISQGNEVFVQGAVMEIDGNEVFRCFGLGQTHFVFTHKNALIWLQVETIGAEKLFRDYFRQLP